MADKKKPVWRERRGEFPHYHRSWSARLNGWRLEVHDTYRLGIGGDGLGKWWYVAERPDGNGAEVHSSAWAGVYWPSHDAAKAAAERFAREAPRA